ncbi:MAG: hypothetical protein JOZ39_00115 [Chloroflexi bacterium]|nr:hypothetical protein [Chloroflexota bacterium]
MKTKASGAKHVIMILDREEGGRARLLSIDESGCQEWTGGSVNALAGEVEALDPDLILVNPDVVSLSGDALAQELNRLLHFQQAYSWNPAPGEQVA